MNIFFLFFCLIGFVFFFGVLQTACGVDFFRLLVLCENNLEANGKKRICCLSKKIRRKKNAIGFTTALNKKIPIT